MDPTSEVKSTLSIWSRLAMTGPRSSKRLEPTRRMIRRMKSLFFSPRGSPAGRQAAMRPFFTRLTWVGPALLVTLLGGSSRVRALKVGQEWSFTGRPTDPAPTLIIDRIEDVPKVGEVVHVSVRGVHIRNPNVAGGISTELQHLPFARSALENSLVKLLKDSVALPDFEPGYEAWKRAKGGAFSISVREALDYVEHTLQ